MATSASLLPALSTFLLLLLWSRFCSRPAPPLDQLLASLERLHRKPPRSRRLFQRQQLDLLIAASDADAATAFARYPQPLCEMLWSSPASWIAPLGERPGRWLSGALARLPEPLVMANAEALAGALSRHQLTGSVPPVFERLLGDPRVRPIAARLLARYRNAVTRELLRRHDGPDLDLDLRLAALLDDAPTAPQPGLSKFLGPAASHELRARALELLLRRPDHAVLHAGALPLVEGCLDDGVAPAAAIRFLFDHADPGAPRRLFDRLWSITQSGKLAWAGVDSLFFSALVVCAPAPELVAILLDTIDDRDFGRALVKAIGEHPDAYLVPALERWSLASPDKATRELAQRALAACRQVSGGD